MPLTFPFVSKSTLLLTLSRSTLRKKLRYSVIERQLMRLLPFELFVDLY